MQMSSNKLPVGFYFRPTDLDLVNHYLKRKITGDIQSEREIIPDIDVYKYDPWDLPDSKFGETAYFFTPKDRKNPTGARYHRSTMSGYWKATGRDRVVRSEGPTSQKNTIGMIKTLIFYKGRAPRGEKTDWVIHEYRIEFDSHNQGGYGSYDLCKLFRRSREKIPDEAETNYLINLHKLDAEVMEYITQPVENKSEPSLLRNDSLTSPDCNLPPRGARNQIDDNMKPTEATIYGREDDKKRIVELILSNNHKNHDINFVCVFSDRGIGKTTMLRLIYHDERVCDSFDTRLFLSMPEKFDEKILLRMIIESLTCTSCDATELETLEEIVKEELTGKKLLLVLDNFEYKDQRFCNFPLVLRNVSLKGSAIVVSSSLEAVSDTKGLVRCYYYLNHLSDYWCWMIFHRYTFGQYSNVDPKLVDIGKHLVAKCRNITCITVLSGLLRHAITEDWWKTISESSLWEMDEVGGDILPVLRVCYEFLPPHLKKCFKYCSLYPKNYLFQKHHLVLMWLSQGFIEPREGRELEEVGLEYFDELVSRSFFEHSPLHETKDKFLMPGLIHDLAELISINECFRSQGCVQNVPKNARHLSLVPNEYQSISFKDLIGEAHNLQTVMVVTRSALQHESISSPVVNLVGMDDQFIKCVTLLTLDLSYTDTENLPSSIGLLKNLRYLGLSGTRIQCIPREISKLFYLETLEAKNCNYLEELPENIQELANLHHLDVTKEPRCVIMPTGIGKLVNLRILPTYNVGIDQSHCRIEDLENLNYLNGSLAIYGLENVMNGINGKKSDLRSKTHLETLSLHWSDIITCDEGDEGAEIADDLLENLQPAQNIRELIIRNYPGIKFSTWIESSAFTNLVSIILDNCYNCEHLPNLGRLPMLRYLSIQKMYGVQRMDLFNGYPSLEILNIWEMYGLEEWIQIKDENSPGDFSRLRTLSINKCPFLRNIPHFSSIIELAIYNCTQLPEIIELPSLTSLKIERFLKTVSIKLPQNLSRLEKLEISQCPELSCVEGLSESTYIENIKIIECPKLDVSKNRHPIHFKEKNDPSVLEQGKGINLNESKWHESKWHFGSWFESIKSLPSDEIAPPSPSNNEQELSKKRKRKSIGDLSMLVCELAEGEEEIKELENHLREQQQSTALDLLENVQNTIRQAMDTATSMEAFDVQNTIGHTTDTKKSMEVFDLGPQADLAAPAYSLQGSRSQTSMTEVQSKPSANWKVSRRRSIVATRRTEVHELEDGYIWRKYGQKELSGAKFPRDYYRCTHRNSQGCLATKQVQRTDEDPNIFFVTYQGEHTCQDHLTTVSPAPALQGPSLDLGLDLDLSFACLPVSGPGASSISGHTESPMAEVLGPISDDGDFTFVNEHNTSSSG